MKCPCNCIFFESDLCSIHHKHKNSIAFKGIQEACREVNISKNMLPKMLQIKNLKKGHLIVA
ncbi:unnamed protein product [Acanthoscelides obtectus]|uniref:Uncharacterized protein n=1 Tax=Acanthoscelides obtectus TaxID=200917 RepID=A0A9P0PBW9_ACAOB|nr:unnamed protein product [Acanthoscelides obtectus]CAK1656521.1 hypothetical protein AOBTE_LOCUS19763 [Acanthoscelides obtectus]